MFSDITAGKVSAGDSLRQLAQSADVQNFLQTAQQFSGVSGLISDASQKLPQLQQRITQASTLMQSLHSGDFSSAEAGQALADMQSSVASAATSELNKQSSPTPFWSGSAALGGHISSIQSALGQIATGTLPADAQQLLSNLTSSLGESGSQLTAISGTLTQAAGSFGSFAAQIQSAQGGVAGLTSAFAEQLGQTAQVKNLMVQGQMSSFLKQRD